LYSTPTALNTEGAKINSHHQENCVVDKIDIATTLTSHFKSSINISSQEKDKKKNNYKIIDQKSPRINTDDSENSSEERGSSRKERKPLPLIFNQSRSDCTDNNDSSSEVSEDTKETELCKCVYLGDKETLTSFWDKCLYQCFKSKRCVAGEKPKRKYRKKPKTLKPLSKKRKQLDFPLSCIDTRGTAMTHNAG